jgi:hypothetical protein
MQLYIMTQSRLPGIQGFVSICDEEFHEKNNRQYTRD